MSVPLANLTACLLLCAHATAAERKPNVLFIAVDDLNDWIGCLGGHPRTRTPNFDRLAASGTLFRNTYCARCCPTRN
jgi:arylsulfatase A-like enzyme